MIGKLSLTPDWFRLTALRHGLLLSLAALLVSSCAGQPQSARPSLASREETRTLQDLDGARVALPIGLLLAGMDRDRDLRLSLREVLGGAAE
ncbi:MAG: hypothetical protein K2P95_07065, partial [Hyphomonadaceae bacterium]|nr:hypothetical protein [Hyphomonadaceae bacterium]